MKCKAIVIPYKKGKGKITLPNDDIAKTVNYVRETWSQRDQDKLDFDNVSICQGKIMVSVLAEDEPYYGGTSATLEVRFRCDTCDHQYYPNLPTSYGLNEWINKLLDGMP
jgi:hypothetical protein